MNFRKSIDKVFSRWSKQDAGENAPNMRGKVDAAAPPPEQESIHEPMMVSPTHAKEIMLDVPDQSTEDVTSIVNDLALNDVSDSYPKPTVPGKRKRQDTDVTDASSRKRVAKAIGVTETRDQIATTSTNGVARHQGRSSRASSEVVKAASGKLPRPKKQQKRHMAEIYPAVQSSNDMWNPPLTPQKQAETASLASTTPKRKSPNSETTPRPRGRPRRVGPSPTEKTTLKNKGQGKKLGEIKAQPGHKGTPEGDVIPEIETGEVCKVLVGTLPQKGGPRARQNSSKAKTNSGDDHKIRTPQRRSTRSIVAANVQEDVILNAITDLTKKPERNARRAAKQRRNLEQASDFAPPAAVINSRAQKRNGTVARNAKNSKNVVHARQQRASQTVRNTVIGEEHGEEEQEESEGEEKPDSVEGPDRDGEMSSYQDEREEGGTEAEEEDSDTDRSSEVVEELELFGGERAWKTILKGAQSVCGPKLPLNHMPKLLTETISDLVYDVKEARELYEQLLPLKGLEQDSVVGLNNDLKMSLDAIDRQITSLSEEEAATKGSQMIRDIYARAIPAMVFLLQSALETRIYHSDKPCDLKTLSCVVTSLEEIVRLQGMAIKLCEKARTWKAKPVPTSRPIIKPTSNEMYPNLKTMHGVFSRSLQEQKRERKVKENAFKTAQKEEDLRLSQQASRETARKNEFWDMRIRRSIEEGDEKRRNAKRSYRQLVQNELQARTQSQQINGHTESNWSEEEDIELYIQLQKGYVPGLTTNERYLKMLNERPLQNKLPQHIRERALYNKPFLLEQEGALEWITSIE